MTDEEIQKLINKLQKQLEKEEKPARTYQTVDFSFDLIYNKIVMEVGEPTTNMAGL